MPTQSVYDQPAVPIRITAEILSRDPAPFAKRRGRCYIGPALQGASGPRTGQKSTWPRVIFFTNELSAWRWGRSGPERKFVMPVKALPPSANLDHLKHQAKDLLRERESRDPQVAQRIREFHPRFRDATDLQIFDARLKLADARLTIARERGFASWERLK